MGRLLRGAAIAVACVLGTVAIALAAAPSTTHGAAVSAAAHATDASGRDHGAAVSALASTQGEAASGASANALMPDAAPTTPPGDHGAAVSAVATDHSTTGKAHGAAVSAVAKTNGGGSGATDTHGSTVSGVATDHSTTGEAHGDAVSSAAQGTHTPPTPTIH